MTVTTAVCAGCIALACLPAPLNLAQLPVSRHWVNLGMMVIEALMGLYILYVGMRARHFMIVALMLAQGAVMGWFEWLAGADADAGQALFVDKFSIIMALINGIVGGGICLYALGYMREYHTEAHRDVPDRRPLFFALLFVFMGAMFGLVFADDLPWLFFFWEITTLCSFLLIGYTQTAEARKNALRALVMNLAGGLTFALAIVCFYRDTHNLGLQALIHSGHAVGPAARRLALLRGHHQGRAMPVLKLAPGGDGGADAGFGAAAFEHNGQGRRLSGLAPGSGHHRNHRRPDGGAGGRGDVPDRLAGGHYHLGSQARAGLFHGGQSWGWSCCAAGIGTSEAVWAGVLLIIFHAVAKCLLFLCVGVVEHKLHSRNIEDMSGLDPLHAAGGGDDVDRHGRDVPGALRDAHQQMGRVAGGRGCLPPALVSSLSSAARPRCSSG